MILLPINFESCIDIKKQANIKNKGIAFCYSSQFKWHADFILFEYK
jgi:hypothetical protein